MTFGKLRMVSTRETALSTDALTTSTALPKPWARTLPTAIEMAEHFDLKLSRALSLPLMPLSKLEPSKVALAESV